MNQSYIDKVAAYYDRIAEEFHKARLEGRKLFNDSIEMPAMFRLIGEIESGQQILDIGCGTGIYTRALASQGNRVTAIDISHVMLSLAESYCHDLEIDFQQVSFEEFQENGSKYDVIIGSFMIGYFSDLLGAFKKIGRLLKPRGFAVLSSLHPVRMSAVAVTDDLYVVKDYFSSGYYYSEIMPDEERVPLFKRTIGEISEVAWLSGLVLEQLVEPIPSQVKYDSRTAFFFHCPTILALRISLRKD